MRDRRGRATVTDITAARSLEKSGKVWYSKVRKPGDVARFVLVARLSRDWKERVKGIGLFMASRITLFYAHLFRVVVAPVHDLTEKE